ncbi:hypothetical protein ERX37_03485 [Macrococcus hajekii]|uniref:Uncharacterized protein n=1 Tax=Macrococcus hajekii TaxID=198482 RepID=A0A4R6BN10_9STAP|nr:hypothetical protein [Macrococcus hajekii]TDM03161.1 hypothetical protein ERX37_03485 [Macrococcus hajekii]GGA96455.1 hypothetical protein GCM10007190_00640 [Macrococcus hajekii]
MDTYELEMIYRDCLTVLRLLKIESPANLMFLPYASLLLYESSLYLENYYNDDEIKNINNNSNINLREVRQIVKLFNDSYEKSIKSIRRSDEITHQYFSKSVFKWRRKTDYNNMGIFFNNQSKVVANSHILLSYFLKGDKITYLLMSKEMHEYGKYIGEINAALILRINNSYPVLEAFNELPVMSNNWRYFDINTQNHKFTTVSEFVVEESILFLHLLSYLNYINYELPKFVNNNSELLLRLKYLTTYYVNYSLLKFINKKRHLKQLEPFFKIETEVEKKEVFNKDFRNCMAHYSLTHNSISYINMNDINENRLFNGLIQSCFHVKDQEYLILLDNKIERLSSIISSYLEL